MSAIDDLKIKVDETKTTLDVNASKLENIHSELDSANSKLTAIDKLDVEPVESKPVEKTREKVSPGKNTIAEKTTKDTSKISNLFSDKDKHRKENEFTTKEREDMNDKFLSSSSSKYKLKRKDKKMIENAEYDATSGRIKEMTISLSIVGIILIVVLRNYLPNNAMFALLIIIGATTFMPIGMIMGWLMFDPVMRCKVLRKVTKRNYGVVQFVGHGSKMFPKIKNFDYSLIWRNNECWVMAESRVYQMSKDGNAINDGKQIDEKNIVTYVDTVPVLFLDTHSMAPMRLSLDGDSSVYPVEIGSSLKAWVDNQRAKMMAIKKMEDMMMIILIGSCVVAAVLCLITMTKVEEMSADMKGLKEQLQFIIEGLKQNPP